MTRTFETHSDDETIALGIEIARMLPTRAVLMLTGNLGAGKTTLSKGIVEGLGAAPRDEVSSPTFTLIHEYSPLVRHIDLYRLDTDREAATLGLDDIFDRDGVVLVEWGEKFPHLLPDERIGVRIEHLGGDSRRITITGLQPANDPEA